MRWRVGYWLVVCVRTRGIWVAIGFLLAVTATRAGAEHGPWDGYCDSGRPVLTHSLPAGTEYTAVCRRGVLEVEFPPPLPPEEKLPPTEFPPDFGGFISLRVNGVNVVNPYQDVEPYVAKSSGRTLIPIRLVIEALGGKAEWFPKERMVRVSWGGKVMEMVIGKTEATVNGNRVVLDQPPIIWKDRTVVPARAVAEAFGAQVHWLWERRTVNVELEGAVCSPHFCRKF